MEPRIQYAKTEDGVSIACYALGRGRSFFVAWGYPSNLQLEWQLPDARAAIEKSAERYRVIRYDARGCGLSDRDVHDFSLDAMVHDMEAVADRMRIGQAVLVARMELVPVAIAFAARNPEKVSHLVLFLGFARGVDFWTPQMAAQVELARSDWELATEGVASLNIERPEVARAIAAVRRASLHAETFVSFMVQLRGWDVSDLLTSLTMPTLIVHRDHRYIDIDVARKLAAALPTGHLVLLPKVASEFEAVEGLVAELLAADESSASATLSSGTAIILFADIVDSTALTERLGDTGFRAKARDLDASLRTIIREHSGIPIEGKLLGDGVLAVFTSARHAIAAALACGKAGEDAGLPLHLGLHAGDVIRESDPDGRDNVYGGAVNIASRISGLSAPGEVLVSDTVRSLARTSAGVRFEDRGEQALKGVGEAVRVWAVREGE